MATKAECFTTFKQYKKWIENLTEKKIKILRTDNGGEYLSKAFMTYLTEHGIIHQTTVPYTPQQNGTAERLNRTLMQTVRSLLEHANLPQEFWAEALQTATYLRNRIPKTSLDNKTPFEVFHGTKPSLAHIRIFGSTAYAFNPRYTGKLNNRGTKCIFLGYGTSTKGYRLIDPTSKRIFYSRSVKFDEYLNSDTTEHKADNADTRQSDDETEAAENSNSPEPNTDPEHAFISVSDDPDTLEAALASEHAEDWQQAIEDEIKSLEQNNTWEYANLPPGRKAIPCKWVFKTKTDATGNIERRKARLVAKGFLQIHGVDFDETYAPTAKYASIRLLLSIAATADLEIHHIDVKNAYLHADLKEEIYMNSPPGQQAPEGKVLRLRKALYGLKQGGKSWYDTISRQLETQGFIRCASENSVFRREASNTEIICLYVDDIIIIAPTPDIVQNIKVDLAKFFSITDLGPLKYFLGIQITRDRQKRTIALSKTTFIQGTLKNFNMNDLTQ